MHPRLGWILAGLLSFATSARAADSSIIGAEVLVFAGASGTIIYQPLGLTHGFGTGAIGLWKFVYLGGTARISNVSTYVGTNTRAGACTSEIRKNGLTTGSLVSIGVGVQNQFVTDATPVNVDLANGDSIELKSIQGTSPGAADATSFVAELAPLTGPTTYILQGTGSPRIGAGSSTNYAPLAGNFFSGFDGTEDTEPYRIRSPGWVKAFQGSLDSISIGAGATCIFTLRKNGADTALTFTLSDSIIQATDTTNRVRVASGDTLDYKIVCSAVNPWADVTTIGCQVESDNGQFDMFANGSETVSAGTGTKYGRMFGGGVETLTTDATNKKLRAPFASRIGRLRIYYGASVVTTATATVRVNGVASALTLSLPVASAGWAETPVGLYIDIAANDEIDWVWSYSGFTGTLYTLGTTWNYDPIGGAGGSVRVIQ